MNVGHASSPHGWPEGGFSAMDHGTNPRDLVPTSASTYQLSTGPTARDVAAVLFRRKRIILTLFLSILLAGTAGATWLRSYWSPPRFAASVKFLIRKDRVDPLVTPADRSLPGVTSTVSPQEIFSEIELLRSADVLERLSREAQVGLDQLTRNLVAEPVVAGRNITNLIAVRYSATDPAEVVRVLNRLPEIYLEKYLSVNRRPAALEYFRSQAEALDQQLREAEGALAEFEKQQPAVGAEGHQQQAQRRLSELEKQKAETEAAIREAEGRTSELERQLQALPVTVPAGRVASDSAYLARLKAQLLDLENRRAQATHYREIQQLEGRIAEARQAIAAESQATAERHEESAPNPLRAPIESELLRNQVLLAGLRGRRVSLAEQERAGRQQLAAGRLIASEGALRRAELARNVKAAEEDAAFYRKKYSEAREADLLNQKRVLNVSVAEGPRPPVRADRRTLGFFAAIVFLLAAGGGVAAGLVAETLDHSVHTPRQLEACSALAVLACIPEAKQG